MRVLSRTPAGDVLLTSLAVRPYVSNTITACSARSCPDYTNLVKRRDGDLGEFHEALGDGSTFSTFTRRPVTESLCKYSTYTTGDVWSHIGDGYTVRPYKQTSQLIKPVRRWRWPKVPRSLNLKFVFRVRIIKKITTYFIIINNKIIESVS